MGVEDGQMFRCDRAPQAHKDGLPHSAFLNPNDKAREEWAQSVEWVDTHGVTISYTLCPECKAEWLAIRQEQRQKTQNFMYLYQE